MNLADYKEEKPHRVKRIVWTVINRTLFRWMGGRLCWPLRRSLLRLFGGQIASDSLIYASCRIYAPWLLTVGRVCIGPNTEIYNKAPVEIGDDSVISQGAFLCSASHDTSDLMMPLVAKPITIGKSVWVAANAFIGPGVTLNDGAVAAACAVVVKDVEPWTIVGGNPARELKKRVIKHGFEQ